MGVAEHAKAAIVFAKICAGVEGFICKDTHPSNFLTWATFGSYAKRIPNARTSMDWVSSDPDMVDRYMEDKWCGFNFTVNGFRTLYELADRCHDREGLAAIPTKLPVLILSGEEDPVGAYGEAARKLYDTYLNLDMTKVQLKLYKGARHELINETDRQTVYQDLLNWILAVSKN